MNQSYRKSDPSDEGPHEQTVQSVSISRRSASRSSRVNKGGKRTVSRSKRRFESAVAQFEVGDRLRQAGRSSLRPRGTSWRPAKFASVLVVVATIVLLGLLHTNDTWFVYAEDVEVRNLTYLRESQIFQQSAIAGWNVFWITPEEIRSRVLANPYVNEANVEIRLPLRIVIDVEELQPIALWVTKDVTYWLTHDGKALPAIASTEADLPQLIDTLGEAKTIADDEVLAVDTEVLDSALALMDRMPQLDHKIRFNRDFGLNFPLPDKQVWVYWGDGQNTSVKLDNLEAAEALLADREEAASLIDVRFIHRPYVR